MAVVSYRLLDGINVELCEVCWSKASAEGVDTAEWIRKHVKLKDGTPLRGDRERQG